MSQNKKKSKRQSPQGRICVTQSSYVGKILYDDEHVVHIASLHWIIFTPGLVLALAGAVLSLNSYSFSSLFLNGTFAASAGKIAAGIALALTILGFSLLLGAFIRQASTELVITEQRIIAKYGFISRSTYEIMVNRISGVNFDQTVMGRIFGYGTILVHGSGGDVSPFHGVADPRMFQQALINVLHKSNNNRNNKQQDNFGG